MYSDHARLMAVYRVKNLNNLETNMRLKDNKMYKKDANAKFMNCKVEKTASYCVYYKILLPSQAQYKNF